MSFISEAILQAGERIRAQLSVDVALRQVVQQADQAGAPSAAAAAARRGLVERLRALEETQAQLRRLSDAVAHYAKVLPFTAEGWPEERARLQGLADPEDGLAEWLDYWFRAASRRRLDALGRLHAEAPLPPGAELLHERAGTAAQALGSLDARLAEPMLSIGCRGVSIGGRRVPDEGTRQDLQLLTARLALHRGLVDQARALLPDDSRNSAVFALRARCARLGGDQAAADALLAEARAADPRDLDVTVELIQRARQRNEFEIALEAAREAVDALQSLADVDADLGRLVEQPAELWVAVAERERRQGDDAVAIRFLDRAAEAAGWDDGECAAFVDETRAGLLQRPLEKRQALLDAGARRVQLGHLEQAQEDFAGAGAGAAVDDAEAGVQASARLRWADVVATLAFRRPFHLVADEVATALDTLLEAQQRVDVAGAESWSYMTEADLRLQLARPVEADRPRHQWAALRASARSVALAPAAALRWRNLADSAWALSLYRVAEAAARQAYALQPDETYRAEHIRALMNLGEYKAGLERLGEAADAWSECVRGYGMLRLGDPGQAIRHLAGVTIDPTWDWAWTTYVSALAIDGQLSRAREESQAFARAVSDRAGERDALRAAAFDARMQGRPEAAVDPARQLYQSTHGEEGSGSLGAALILTGDAEGWDVIADGISRSVDPTELMEWDTSSRPLLEVQAADLGLPPLSFDVLEPVLAAFRTRLAAGIDVGAELRTAAALPSAPAEAATIAEFVQAVLGVAADDERAGTGMLSLPAGDELRAEVESLRTYRLDRAMSRQRRELARSALRMIAQPGSRYAGAVLGTLLDQAPDQAAELLRQEAGEQVPAEVLGLLSELADDPRRQAAARRAHEALSPDSGTEAADRTEPHMRMELPASWFAGSADPVNEHPLFLRYLPELRARADWPVPAVNVSTDEALEPGGYRILVDGELARAGQLDPSVRYASAEALDLLPGAAAGHPAPVSTDHGWTVPIALPADPGLVELLSMSAVEVAVRVYGDVARQIEQSAARTPEPDPAPAPAG